MALRRLPAEPIAACLGVEVKRMAMIPKGPFPVDDGEANDVAFTQTAKLTRSALGHPFVSEKLHYQSTTAFVDSSCNDQGGDWL